jgi:hypothetical protein
MTVNRISDNQSVKTTRLLPKLDYDLLKINIRLFEMEKKAIEEQKKVFIYVYKREE